MARGPSLRLSIDGLHNRKLSAFGGDRIMGTVPGLDRQKDHADDGFMQQAMYDEHWLPDTCRKDGCNLRAYVIAKGMLRINLTLIRGN